MVQTVLASQNTSAAAAADDVYAMSSLDLADVMDDFSQMNVLSVVVACLLMVSPRSPGFWFTVPKVRCSEGLNPKPNPLPY